MLLIEANMPGTFVATELQVRTRSAFLNTRLDRKMLVYDSLSLPFVEDSPDNVDVVVGHLQNLPGFVAGEPKACLKI